MDCLFALKMSTHDILRSLGENSSYFNLYFPNGQSVGSPAYEYKLRFLQYLYDHLSNLLSYEEVCVVGGDYNIAPTDQDVYNPSQWAGKIFMF